MSTTEATRRPSSVAPRRSRSVALSIALWTFGLATSLFLLGMWGRIVVVDDQTIEDSARTIIDSELVTDRINSWFEEAIATVADLDSETSQSVVHAIEAQPEYAEAVDSVIGVFVDSLFANDGGTQRVDIDGALSPLVPVVADELAERDIHVEVESIEDMLDDASVVELDAGQAATVAAVVVDARVILTQVVALSVLGMLLAGAVAVALASERYDMFRQLSIRVVVAALSYAVVLRLAGWAVDPSRGRSPIAAGAAVLFSSNSEVFMILGAVAAGIAAVGYRLARRTTDAPVEESHDVVDDDTRELASV